MWCGETGCGRVNVLSAMGVVEKSLMVSSNDVDVIWCCLLAGKKGVR